MTYVVVPDIHGNVHNLRHALNYINALNAKAIFLGDYVDKQPFTNELEETLDILFSLVDQGHIMLRGNHDNFLAKDIMQGGALSKNLDDDISSYFTSFIQLSPKYKEKFLEFNSKLVQHVTLNESKQFIFTHAACRNLEDEKEVRGQKGLSKEPIEDQIKYFKSVGDGVIRVFGHLDYEQPTYYLNCNGFYGLDSQKYFNLGIISGGIVEVETIYKY